MFSFAYFFVLVCLVSLSGPLAAAQVPPGQSVGSTFDRAKLEKKTEAMEQSLARRRTEPEIEDKAATSGLGAIARQKMEEEDIRSRVIS